MKFGIACKCTRDSCGAIPSPDLNRLKAGTALVVTSQGQEEATSFMKAEYVPLRSAKSAGTARIGRTARSGLMVLDIDASTRHQKIIGFGGAFTDAVAHNYASLGPAMQRRFIESYFGEGGSGYTVGRVNMNGCDFSRMDYSLDNATGDYDLEHFCLRDDSAPDAPCGADYKVPVIRAAQTAIAASGGERLRLFASTWSAPLWLKSQAFECRVDHGSFYPPGVCSPGGSGAAAACTRSAQWSQTGATDSRWLLEHPLIRSTSATPAANAGGDCYLTGFLRPEPRAMETWARFFSRFIAEYRALGVEVWGVTVQNEPLATTSLWPAMYYTAELQAEFLAKHLGPTLRRDHGDVKIMIHDDDTNSLLDFAGRILSNEAAAKYVDGVAYHWYASMGGVYENGKEVGLIESLAGRWAQKAAELLGFTIPTVGGGSHVGEIWRRLQAQSAEKFVLPTEACNGANIGQGNWFGPSPGNWMYGYAYSHDVLWQLRNNAAGWTDWNLMLDQRGGPNAFGNFIASAVTFQDEDTIYHEPMYFHLAHFSKFVLPGSTRVDLGISCGAGDPLWCQAVAFMRPDGYAVVVLTNDELTGLPFGDVKSGIPLVSRFTLPTLARGEGRELAWTISCGPSAVSGTIPWKAIQTVVLPCGAHGPEHWA